ncbi:hypothetical protein M9H77_00147 [Catharanthus roseus]|nr:hypothetical protein M9H77_00147 [Catharanthus roseus]
MLNKMNIFTTTSLRVRLRVLGLIEFQMNGRTYTTEISKSNDILNSIFQGEERCEHKEVHPGLIIASHHFGEPYPLVKEIERFSLVTMDLLNQFAYPYISAYAKFTISMSILKPHIGEILTSTIGLAIPLTFPDNSLIPRQEVYSRVYDSISLFSEKYEGELVSKLMIRVYMDGKKERNSLNLLPGKLKDLARNLCPELGQKGSIPHEEITLSNLLIKKPELINYLRQDILLLGGIMKKAQEIYWTVYNVDIESKITVSSLALTIFRMKYYDASNWPIYIPNMNEDSFIRRGYYGGHTDVYIPYGENLYYYDVNSLYPFIMKEYPMPGGRPEFKYARDLGYTVIPISGYLFEKKESPFKSFVSSLFESRLEAKKSGNNSITKTEICDENRYKYLLRKPDFIFGELLDENTYVVSYHDEPSPDSWNPMKNAAVQLAAAITASARMYMYPYTSREDSYYTDTDSVVLAHPLPEEIVSSSVLGKFALEDKIVKGLFLAPKAYSYNTIEGSSVLKFKGPAKNRVSPEWFEEQYKNLSRKLNEEIVSYFRIDWHHMNIIRKETLVRLGIKLGTKRDEVFKDDLWVDTKPIEVKDLSRLNYIETQTIKSLLVETHILKLKLSHEQRKIDNEINIDPKNNTLSSTEIDHPDGIMKEREQTKHTLDQDKASTEQDKDLTREDKALDAKTEHEKAMNRGNKDPPKDSH